MEKAEYKQTISRILREMMALEKSMFELEITMSHIKENLNELDVELEVQYDALFDEHGNGAYDEIVGEIEQEVLGID